MDRTLIAKSVGRQAPSSGGEILQRLSTDLYGKGAVKHLWLRIFAIYFIKYDTRKVFIYLRLGQLFRSKGLTWLVQRMAHGLRRDFGCMVHFDSDIGPGLVMPHPIGIVIGQNVKIGARCRIYQQVTIGGARLGDWQAGRYPRIGDDVTIFAGAKLIGPISIGDGAVIGANSVVTKDVPAGCTAKGIPAVI